MEPTMASNLTKFIHSLDPRTLPRVLQIQSGIYFQGSIYEMFGNECCLPTGELIKVTGFKINKIIASICESNEDSQCSARIELPLNFPGTRFATVKKILTTVWLRSSGVCALDQGLEIWQAWPLHQGWILCCFCGEKTPTFGQVISL
uniref:CABIT domain-containing protein n=1 Tax=Chelonoidis abingdonii TaxID=106734 RepID=A0A8C0H5J6_CHEAB